MRIYNTINRQKDEFIPITPGNIKMYTCGQTVYNDIHMGNARFYVVYDAIRRYLEYRGYNVEYVQNFTDIDDKTIQRAREEGITTEQIAEKYIASTKADLAALNVKPATFNPRVTEEIPAIKEMISQLISSGHAYENNGTVYYAVDSFADYGKLSKKNIDDLEAGARVEVEQNKKNPMDFVLWKPAKPGEPSWESPWSNGRPGWHIECSAMIRKYLGDQIDIHGGGTDLIFPHHENEIAQSEAVTGKNFANYWMHCGMITVDHKKMSKSQGNFATLKEVAEKYPYDVIRFFILSGYYRSPMEFTDTVLTAAQQGLNRIKNCYSNILHAIETGKYRMRMDYLIFEYDWEKSQINDVKAYVENFMQAMDDDFNTADAITAVFELVKYTNTTIFKYDYPYEHVLYLVHDKLTLLMDILGISLNQPKDESEDNSFADKIESLIAARKAARKAKDFAEADRIRDEIASLGVVLEDTREGVRWHKA
ncbi:MAG: cysteine--tRNA ligase [Firmicutes bacterium]|nr:cysteine--tRNA ligase [Bacillota bacterium]